MPLYLVKVRRQVRLDQEGEFVVESDDLVEAQKTANRMSANPSAMVEVPWVSKDIQASTDPVIIEEVEILAEGTEDIRERF